MRRIIYGALASLIATPVFSVPLDYVNFTYFQPNARYQTCGTPFSYGDAWDGDCGELDEFGNTINHPWPDKSASEFEIATLWINTTIDRSNLTISSSDTASDWESHFAYQEWGIIPFGMNFLYTEAYWADGWASAGGIDFTIRFDEFGEITEWSLGAWRDDGGALSFTAFSDPQLWDGHEYYASEYWEPSETAVYRDRGYWISDAPPPSPIPLPAPGLLLLGGLIGLSVAKWKARPG